MQRRLKNKQTKHPLMVFAKKKKKEEEKVTKNTVPFANVRW